MEALRLRTLTLAPRLLYSACVCRSLDGPWPRLSRQQQYEALQLAGFPTVLQQKQQQQQRDNSTHRFPELQASSTSTHEQAVSGHNEVSSLRCTLQVSGEQADAVVDSLLSFGAQSACVEEHRPKGAEEEEIFDNRTRQLWRHCRVTAYFAAGQEAQKEVAMSLRQVQDALGLDRLECNVEEVLDQEWVESIKATYQPIMVAPGLWILPDWATAPDPSALTITMEPGLAFGTGEHPTTRLCLAWLHAMRDNLGSCSVLDWGTGSGVLAIGALKMGAASAVGTDVDELAVKGAARNAELNGVGHRFVSVLCSANAEGQEPSTKQGGSTEAIDGQLFDVCLANILQEPLLELAPRLAAHVKRGGRLALSGILLGQADTVVAAYEAAGFTDMHVSADEQRLWALVAGHKA